MGYHQKNEAGSAPTLPDFEVARYRSKAISQYKPKAMTAMELASREVARRFGLPRAMAKTIAELAGMGGRT